MISNPECRLISVGGPPGVGKTSILREIVGKSNIHVVHVSRRLDEFTKRWRNKPFAELILSERDLIRETVALEILRDTLEIKGVALIDLHYSDTREGTNRILFPSFFFAEVDDYIVLDAPEHVILQRRQADLTRQRNLDIEQIKVERNTQVQAAIQLATEYRKTVRTIDVSVEMSKDELLKILVTEP